MKRYLNLFLSLTAAVLLVSCTPDDDNNDDGRQDGVEKTQLAMPELRVLSQGTTSFTVVWDIVEGASMYNYICDWTGSDISSTQDTVLTFENLEKDAVHTLSVWAMPADPERYTESPVAVIEVTTEIIGDAFTIEYEDNRQMMVLDVTITPKDPGMMFFRETLEDNYFQYFGGNVEDAWANALQSYVDMFGSSALVMVAEKGTVNYPVEYIYDQHTYIMVAGIDSSLNRITSIVDTVFYSGPVPASDITFEVEAREITTSSAVVYVTPSNNDPWSMLLLESDDLSEYSEADVENLVNVSYREYINDGRVYSGDMSMTYREGSLDADTEYTVLVFGWNTALSTDVYRYTFTTESASSSQDLTFTWNIEVLGPMEIDVTITPSDMNAQYIVIPMPDYDYESFGTDIDAYLEYVMMGEITPYQYVSMFATTGVTDRVFNEFDDGIYPQSSYMFMAIGVDLDNSTRTVKFYEPQLYGEMVTTPAQ